MKHEKRWYEKWGLNYYGCCEPLHHKVEVLRRNIPRLRRISMSPFIDFDKAVENVRGGFIFAWKPNPAVLAESTWHPEAVRRDMEEKLSKAKRFNCVMEIHMKDISTVRYQPQRLWEWARIASEVAEKYVGRLIPFCNPDPRLNASSEKSLRFIIEEYKNEGVKAWVK